ncbi:FAD-binding domain-containing protein [Periconia macrospinosa]|uniref:Delta(24)-sterol reductase n=1 Tax=Periconia macrospinosa TaxID=97972 RepID=A0A2V1DU41_9PLEO|nr:FAD-binding domain-containing protein [Periconia macrospinosa]
MDTHNATVAAISSKVSAFHASSTPFRIYHGSTLSTRTSSRQKSRIIDTSSLNHVLRFNTADKTVLVEPNVPMDALVDATMPHGLVPKVVMELPNITVGGGFAGTSGESSSFRHGLFDRGIRGIEIVLGNGDVVWAARDNEHRELFFACAGSCGSLGVITLVEMELMDAKPWVELEYHAVQSIDEAVQLCAQSAKDPSIEYIDGIMYSLTKGVIMTGRLRADASPHPIRSFDKPSDPWLYIDAEEILNNLLTSPPSQSPRPPTFKQSIPLKPYLFRYDRGVFWSGLRAFTYFLTPFNALTRYLLDPFMRSRTMIHALHRSGLASQALIQDLAVPFDKTDEFIRWTDQKTGLWPLWLCPVRKAPRGEESFSMGGMTGGTGSGNFDEELLMDVGIWGMGPKNPTSFIALNRAFERKITDLNGLKCLYAHAYYTEEEFWGIYDKEKYDGLREKYHAVGLPSVYEKVKVDLKGVAGPRENRQRESWGEWVVRTFWQTWPLGGLYGVASATKGLLVESDFLLK